MVGRTYNIARLVSRPEGIYFEGDPLLSVDALNIKDSRPTRDPIATAEIRNDIYLKITKTAVIKARFTLLYPGYDKDDFICYSVFDINKIKIREYREIIKDMNYLKFMKMKPGVMQVLKSIMNQFDYVITDVPYLFNDNETLIYDISKLNFYKSEYFKEDVDYPKEIGIPKPVLTGKCLVLLLYDRFLSFDIHKSIPQSAPFTLVRYPVRKELEGKNLSRYLECDF